MRISDNTLRAMKLARIRELQRAGKPIPSNLREGPTQNNLDKKYVRVAPRNATSDRLEPWYPGGRVEFQEHAAAVTYGYQRVFFDEIE